MQTVNHCQTRSSVPPSDSGGAAAAALRVPAAATDSAHAERSWSIIRGAKDDYQVLDQLDRDTVYRISRETGLQIHLPLGGRSLGVVTTWSEEPNGKLCLGQGACGVFCLGRAVHGDQFVGLKFSERSSKSQHESAVQKSLQGIPGILQSIDFGTCDERSCHVIELAGLGSLAKLKQPLRQLTNWELQEQLLCHIARGVLKALDNLHQKSTYHLDMKPDNIVVDHRGKVLIIDFDCAQHSETGVINVLEAEGDSRYDAPERTMGCWSGSRERALCSGEKLDAWSAGLVLIELFSDITLDPTELNNVLNQPYESLSPDLQKILADHRSAPPQELLEQVLRCRLPIPDSELGEVLRGLLDCDPEKRLTPAAALRLPWFRRMKLEDRGIRGVQHLQAMVRELMLKRGDGALSPQELPLLPMNHVHRRELQTAIRDHLLSESRRTVLQGGHGSGKSQLATYFASLNQVQSRFGSVLWFRRCDDPFSIEVQWMGLAHELGLISDEMAFSAAFPIVKHHFESQPNPPLIIYDNAGSSELLAPYVDLPGHLLITTNNMDWDDPIVVKPLTSEDALALVASLIGHEDPLAGRLSSALAYSPLALAQACAYMRNHSVSIEKYLDLLEEGTPLQSDEKQSGYRDIPYSIQKMYELTFEKIPDALPLLHRLACLAPEPIPSSFAELLGSEEHVMQLRNHSLLQTTNGSTYTLHQVPGRLILEQLSISELVQAMGACMAYAGVRLEEERRSHIQLILTHARHLIQLQTTLNVPSERLGRTQLGAMGAAIQYAAALSMPVDLELLPRMVELCFDLCKPSDRMYSMHLSLVESTLKIHGKHADLLLLHIRKVRNAEKFFGNDHPNTAACLVDLGTSTVLAQRHHDAVGVCRRALSILKQQESPDAFLLSRCLQCLGSAYAHIGRNEIALEHLRESLEIVQQKHGERNREFAEVLEAIANSLSILKRYEEAVQHFQQALEIVEQANGKESSKAGAYRSHLAQTYAESGDLPNARREYTLALEILSKIDNHLLLAAAHRNYGILLKRHGEHQDAIQHFKKSLPCRQEYYGRNSTQTVQLLEEMAVSWDALQRGDEVLKCHTEILSIEQVIHGPEHSTLPIRMAQVGLAKTTVGMEEDGRRILRRAIATAEAHPELGKDHAMTARIREMLASCTPPEPDGSAAAQAPPQRPNLLQRISSWRKSRGGKAEED